MNYIEECKNFIIRGGNPDREMLEGLINQDISELCLAANSIREYFCSNNFDICSIISGKCSRCSEDCRYCAQSSLSSSRIDEQPIPDIDSVKEAANYCVKNNITRLSIVNSGRKPSNSEIIQLCRIVSNIKEKTDIYMCVSPGLADYGQLSMLKDAGVSRIHNNLEVSSSYFRNICTTHGYVDKIGTILLAREAGLDICSGGILGVGENIHERIELALELKRLEVKSVPLNILVPIKGTPLERMCVMPREETKRTVSIMRFALPDAYIRLAGGRHMMDDLGEELFSSGANAAITGDMLTTKGSHIKKDMEIIKKLGYKVAKAYE